MSTVNWSSDHLYTYRLVRAWECGSKTIRRIRDIVRAQGAIHIEDLRNQMRLTDAQTSALVRSMHESVDADLRIFDAEDIRFLLPEEGAFPGRLQTIPDPPAALFTRGHIGADGLRIAIVGTRRMTSYGKRCADFFARELVAAGVTIVSGLAFGVDAIAHKSAIEAGGQTIAVLPCGVTHSSITPRSHLDLAERILASGGGLVSEQAPGTPSLPYRYLHRNRLIAGLSDAVLVVEGDHDSGAVVTAKLALEQGKDVLAIPGSIWSPPSRGTNELIKHGAAPCTSLDDLWMCLHVQHAERAKAVQSARAALPASPEESALLEHLVSPISIDELTRLAKRPTSEISALISILEMKGHIISVSPKTYVRSRI